MGVRRRLTGLSWMVKLLHGIQPGTGMASTAIPTVQSADRTVLSHEDKWHRIEPEGRL